MSLQWEDVTDSEESAGEFEWGGSEAGTADPCKENVQTEHERIEQEMEEKRVDPTDGRAYCKREFIECYGDEQQWDIALQPDAVPWACEYCGVTDVQSVLRCDRMDKWFCNGTHGTSGCSHITMHLILSGNNTLSVHEKSSMAGVSLACCVCENRNVFALGHMPHATEEDATIVVCREPCLHSGSTLFGETDAWKPLIIEKQLPEWIAGQPKTTPSFRPSMKHVRRLEEVWKSEPTKRIKELDKTEGDTDGVPLHFSDGVHFRQVMLPFVRCEAEEDKNLTESVGLKKVEIHWENTNTNAVSSGGFTFHQGDSVTLGMHDRVKLETECGWTEIFRVSSVESNKNRSGSHFVRIVTDTKRQENRGRNAHLPPGPYHLSPVWNGITYKRQEEALQRFADSETCCSERVFHALLGHGQNFIEENDAVAIETVPGLPPLNHSQVQAITTAMRQSVSLIQGPPGTGKTTTSAAVAFNLAKVHSKLLACCPSNTAADHLAAKIAKTGLKVIRLASRVKESTMASRSITTDADFLYLHRQIECVMESQADSTASQLLRRKNFGRGLTEREEGMLFKGMKELEQLLIREADIIVTTCCAAADVRIKNVKFPAVLLDEATQATEPQALIPITLGCQQLVLIGDHKQLGPVVLNLDGKSRGYDRSMFERMVCLGTLPHPQPHLLPPQTPTPQTTGIVPEKLTVQYRMHPALSVWPSGVFYDGALQNGLPESMRASDSRVKWKRGSDYPIAFVHEACPEELGGSGTSYLNRAEAMVVERNVIALLEANVPPQSIGVITPYDGQRCHILARFSRSSDHAILSQLKEVEVASVDAFQGREKAYIILSCVRSNEAGGLGFLSDPRRLNVSLTRAQRGMVIVGNVRSLGRNTLWHSLLQHMSDIDVICTGDLKDGFEHCNVQIPEPRVNEHERKIAGWSVPEGEERLNEVEAAGGPDIPNWLELARDADVISQTAMSELPSHNSSSAGPPSLLSTSTMY